MLVHLDLADFQFCLKNGLARYKDGLQVANKNGYSKEKKTGGEPVMYETMSLMAEMAVIRAMGLDAEDPSVWTPFVARVNGRLPESAKKPDVAGIVEVRNVTRVNNPLRVWPKDRDAVVVKAHVKHHKTPDNRIGLTGEVELIGWRFGGKAYDGAIKHQGVAHVYALKPMGEFPYPLPGGLLDADD